MVALSPPPHCCGIWGQGSKFWLFHYLLLLPWAGHFPPLNLSFFIYKAKRAIVADPAIGRKVSGCHVVAWLLGIFTRAHGAQLASREPPRGMWLGPSWNPNLLKTNFYFCFGTDMRDFSTFPDYCIKQMS